MKEQKIKQTIKYLELFKQALDKKKDQELLKDIYGLIEYWEARLLEQ